MTALPQQVEKDKKEKKSKSAGKDKKESPEKSKKGKKKKSAKAEKIYIESYDIPIGTTKGFNLYRPDRGTM